MNSDYKQPVGPTIVMIYGFNMSFNIMKLYMDGL